MQLTTFSCIMNLFPKRKKRKKKKDRLQSLSNFISLLSLKHLSASLSKAYSKGLKKSSFIWPLTNEFTIIYLGPDRYLIQYKSPTILIIFVDAPFRLLTFSLTLDPKTIITAKRTIVDRIQKLVTKREM